MAQGTTFTLSAGVATKLLTGEIGPGGALVKTALTDLFIGGPNVSSGTNGCLLSSAAAGTVLPVGRDDLWALSATGGVVYVFAASG